MPLNGLALPFGALSIQADDEEEDGTVNFSSSASSTLEIGGIKVHGETGMQRAGEDLSSTALSDLERLEILGTGASSRVYLCQHRRTGDRFALKKLMAADTSSRQMALNEIKLAQSELAIHDHLMLFVDAYFDQGDVYLLMEFADAGAPRCILTGARHSCALPPDKWLLCPGSLDDAIRRSEGVPESVMRSVMLQLANGLGHLHHKLHLVGFAD